MISAARSKWGAGFMDNDLDFEKRIRIRAQRRIDLLARSHYKLRALIKCL